MTLMYAPQLLERTPLARAMIIGLGAFWGARFLVQACICAKPSWRGAGADAVLQFSLAALCAYFAVVCAWALVSQTGGLR